MLNEEITAIIHGEIYTRSGLECKGLITTKKTPFDQGPVNGEGKGEINSKFIQHPGTGGFRPILSGGEGPIILARSPLYRRDDNDDNETCWTKSDDREG